MSLGLPEGAETETDSMIATPSKGLVSGSQTPDHAIDLGATGIEPVTCVV